MPISEAINSGVNGGYSAGCQSAACDVAASKVLVQGAVSTRLPVGESVTATPPEGGVALSTTTSLFVAVILYKVKAILSPKSKISCEI